MNAIVQHVRRLTFMWLSACDQSTRLLASFNETPSITASLITFAIEGVLSWVRRSRRLHMSDGCRPIARNSCKSPKVSNRIIAPTIEDQTNS